MGTRRALASHGMVAVMLKERNLLATAWPLRDMSSFQKLDFINQVRSYLSLLSWLLLGQSYCLSGRNFSYTKLRGNINTLFQCNSAHMRIGKLLRAQAVWRFMEKRKLSQVSDLEPQEMGD